jgi:hypothetical protein
MQLRDLLFSAKRSRSVFSDFLWGGKGQENRDAPVIVAIRFSVLQSTSKAFRIQSGQSFANYKDTLFDPKRLAQRLHSLSSVTLPSIAGQSQIKNVHVVIYTSTELPRDHHGRLSQEVSRFPFAKVCEIAPNEKLDCNIELKNILASASVSLYAHARLDDDDALARDYVERLRNYLIEENVGKAISFGSGVAGIFDVDTGLYTDFFRLYQPKSSCGLAVVGSFDRQLGKFGHANPNAHTLGNHLKVDMRVPLILDSRQVSFLYSMHPGQDTAALNNKRMGNLSETVDVAEVERRFAISRDVIGSARPMGWGPSI